MNIRAGNFQVVAMIFAEILNDEGKRVHIGCIMAAGEDWIEVSVPAKAKLPQSLHVRVFPSLITHAASEKWRRLDRVGMVYVNGGPLTEQFYSVPGIYDPRPASLKAHS